MKHEQAILVALAYVIGFTTAFIAFSINNDDGSQNINRKYKAQNNTELVAHADAVEDVRALVTDEGLFVLRDGKQRILSAQVSSAVVENTKGFHKKIIATTVYQDGKFIYYCAQVDDSNQCLNFIYSLEEDKVYSVEYGDTQLTTDFATAKETMWSKNGLINIGDAVSKNSSTPWLLK